VSARRWGWALLAVVVASGVAGLLLAGRGLEAAGSSLSRGAQGWLAARLYLEARGTRTELLRAPLAEALAPPTRRVDASPPRTLVLVFPWQSRAVDVEVHTIREHLAGGGDLLLGYSSEPVPGGVEKLVLSSLGMYVEPVEPPSLGPLAWRREAREPWRLRLADRWPRAGAETADLELRRRLWVPMLRKGRALLVGPEDRVVAAAWRVGRGRVVVLPAELLCNARLGAPAHAALLETLRPWLRGPWLFDEHHHGLMDAATAVPTATRRGFDLLLAQLAVLYLAAALALGRRLGPAWRERPPLVGGAASFLLRLGALHHRLGHHRDGAELLLRRAAELDRRFAPGPELAELAARGDAAALVAVGRAVGRRQHEGIGR
jgi:hypothetical protein